MKRLAIAISLVSVLAGCTSNASSQPGVSSATPSTASGFSRVYERGGSIFVEGANGSVALTRGLLPEVSPDRTWIAFLRDPRDPHHEGHGGDPFLLQAWLIHPDGSGLRKLGQQHGCCVGLGPDLYWSPGGSSVVLTGTYVQWLHVG